MRPDELEVGTLFRRKRQNRIFRVIEGFDTPHGFMITYAPINRDSILLPRSIIEQNMYLYEIVPAPLNAENLRTGYQI